MTKVKEPAGTQNANRELRHSWAIVDGQKVRIGYLPNDLLYSVLDGTEIVAPNRIELEEKCAEHIQAMRRRRGYRPTNNETEVLSEADIVHDDDDELILDPEPDDDDGEMT